MKVVLVPDKGNEAPMSQSIHPTLHIFSSLVFNLAERIKQTCTLIHVLLLCFHNWERKFPISLHLTEEIFK